MAGEYGGSWWNPIDNLAAIPDKIRDPNYDLVPGVSNPFSRGDYVDTRNNPYVLGSSTSSTPDYSNSFVVNSGSTRTVDGGIRKDTSGNSLSSSTGSYGTGSTGAPAYDPVELGLIDNQIGLVNKALGRVPNQQRIGLENILNSYFESQNQLNKQLGLAERDYNTTKDQTGQDFTNTRANIRSQAGNQFTGLQRLLGSMGAGRSSAAQIMAPFAVGREAAQRFGTVEDQFSRNQQSLDTSFGDTQSEFESLQEQLDADKRRKENELRSGLATNKTTLLDQLAGLQLQRQQLMGGGLDDVMSAIQPYQSKVQSLLDQIDNFGRQYANSVRPTGSVAFNTPDLAQYNYSRFSTPTVNGQPDPRNDYTSPLTPLLAEDEERKRNQV